MPNVNKCLSLLACLTALLVQVPSASADLTPPSETPEASSPLPEFPGSYVVRLSDSATSMERRAGELLREGLGMGDSGLGASEGQSTIYVGASLASMTLGRARATPVDWASRGGDGVAIFKADNGDMVIAGGRAPGGGGRGTMHGVVRFLEDRAGCRWWPDGTALIPQKTVPRPGGRGLGGASDEPYELIGRPAFGGASMWPAAWALGEPDFGREQALGGAYYVATAAGKLESPPTHADGSVCLSDGVLREAVIAAVRQDLEASYPRVKRVVLGVGYRDEKTGYGHDCKACSELTESSGSPAGVLLGFGNAVAKAVAEDYPEARIVLTFEGEDAKPPSGIRAEPNLVIRWVHDPYKEGVAGEHRAAGWPFLAELRAWAAVGGTLEMVEPLVDTRDYLAPQGGLYDLGLRLRQAKAFGVKNVDFLGAPNCAAADWLDMRKWVAGHLAWDPTRDVRGLTEDYMTGYYGDAGLYLMGCLDRVRAVEVETGAPGMSDGPLWRRLTLEDLNFMTDQFNSAERVAAQDELMLTRVRKARLPLTRVWLERYSELKAEAERTGSAFNGPGDPAVALEVFIADAKASGVGAYRQGADGGLNSLIERVQAQLGAD